MRLPPASIASALDEIRQVEAEVTRQIGAARVAAQERIALAEKEARTMKQESRAMGLREGEAEYCNVIERASDEAEQLIQKASLQAESLRQMEAHQLAVLTRCIVECVTTVEGRQVPHEPEDAVLADHWP